jgi:hypothetical protein
MWRLFSFGAGGRGRPWGRREAGRRWQLARSASVQEEEEGGQLGRGGKRPNGSADYWADWAESRGKFLSEIKYDF